MNWSKIKLKNTSIISQVTNSYLFDATHNAGTYLFVIEQILNNCGLLDGRKPSGWEMTSEYFKTTVYRRNHSDTQIDCQIEFKTTTLTITVKVIE